MTMFRQSLKNNVENEIMRNKRLIEDFRIMIEIAIDLNNKWYERAMKRQYSRQHLEQGEDYINYQIYSHRIGTLRNSQFCSFLQTNLRF